MTDTLTPEQRLRSWDRCWPGNINIEMAINEAADELARLSAEVAALRKALEFYADVSKYPAPLTGGMGDLWADCGQIARAALNQRGADLPV